MSEGQNNNTPGIPNVNSQGTVSWGSVGGKKGNVWSEIDRLKLKDPNTQYRMRLIGDPFRFFKLYEPIEVTLGASYNEELEVFKAGHTPSARYAIWVFDRNDSNKIKLFEGGPMIFQQFGTYQEIIGDDPGGEVGPDWSVSFNDPIGENGKPNPRLRQYRCMHIKPAPFTDEERKRIAEHVGKYSYDQILKGSDDEWINKLWEEAKNAPEGARVPGSYLWNQDRKQNRDQQAAQDLNLDTPRGEQQPVAPADAASAGTSAAPPVDTSAAGDGFEDTFKTGTPAGEGAQQNAGGTSLF